MTKINNLFLMFNYNFWQHKDIIKFAQHGDSLHFLINLLYLSFEWHHKPFFRTSEQIYAQLNTYKVDLNRKIKLLKNLNIKITYQNKKYFFDLTDFFEKYQPLSNKSVTK